MGNLSYRRTVSTPGNELFPFSFFLAEGGGVGGVEMNFGLKRTKELTKMSMAFCSKTHGAALEGQPCLGNVSNFCARMCDRVLFLMFFFY